MMRNLSVVSAQKGWPAPYFLLKEEKMVFLPSFGVLLYARIGCDSLIG